MERLNIIRAIRGTTGIEGNQMTEEEVAIIVDQAEPSPSMSNEEQENYNAREAMKWIKEQPVSTPLILNEGFIKKLHRITTQRLRSDLNVPGEYRRDVVYAGIFEFPDPKDVPHLMSEFISFINSERCIDIHPIIRAVLAHFYFVHVHPFSDGNGRVARAIETYMLYHGGYGAVGFYSLANFYYRNRKEYIQQLDDAKFKHDGDLTEFVRFALEGFLLELRDLNKQGAPYMKVVKYAQHVDRLVEEGTLDQRLGVALKAIAETEEGIPPREFAMRIPVWVKKLYRGKSERTLRADLTLMRKSGLINEEDGRIRANLLVVT